MTDWNKEVVNPEYYVQAVVRKVGTQYCVFSKSGKKLGCYPTKKKAQDRLRQIEFFKHKETN